MRAAVIGGGTAGFMAAVHLSKHFPSLDLIHIYDSRIPTIGVGEGTTPPFTGWLHDTIDITFPELQQRCLVTHKAGIRFENWGRDHARYTHYFSPAEGNAYHISAPRLAELLQHYVTATVLDRKVVDVHSTGSGVSIHLEGGEAQEVDIAFDARGFPKEMGREHVAFSCIPTNAALIRRGPVTDFRTATRAVARPGGWIFGIPLTTHSAYGYIYNDRLSSRAEIRADFDRFLMEEEIRVSDSEKQVRFPNYTRRALFDGALFRIGNAASFLEPLEATAIGNIVVQLRLATVWLLDILLDLRPSHLSEDQMVSRLNDQWLRFIRRTVLFVSWHYACGARFDTPFWRFARQSFAEWYGQLAGTELAQEFETYLALGAALPKALAFVHDPQDFARIPVPDSPLARPFGGFLDISFAKVGYGTGYYDGAPP